MLYRYRKLKTTYSRQRAEAEQQAEVLREQIEQETDAVADNCGWMEQFRKYQNIDELDRTIVVSLIERVVIYRGNRVEIVFRCHNEFQAQIDLLRQAGAALSKGEAV